MAKIVKNLDEANKLGLLGNNSQQKGSDVGKIVSDIKDILNTFKELRGSGQEQKSPSPQMPKQMDFNTGKTEIKKKSSSRGFKN